MTSFEPMRYVRNHPAALPFKVAIQFFGHHRRRRSHGYYLILLLYVLLLYHYSYQLLFLIHCIHLYHYLFLYIRHQTHIIYIIVPCPNLPEFTTVRCSIAYGPNASKYPVAKYNIIYLK